MRQKLTRISFIVTLAILTTFRLAVPTALADPASPITVTNTDSPDPIASGAEITYTIVITNTGGSRLENVVMADQLNGVAGIGVPPQLQITSTRGSCTQSVTLVTCSAGTIEGNGAWFISIRGIVTAPGGTVINNTATVTGTRSAQNFTTTVTASTLVTGGGGGGLPDLAINKNGPSSVVVSSPMTYTLTVNNLGSANATNVKVVDTVPGGITAISATGTSLFTCGVAGQTVTCTGGAVNAGSNATITINGTSPAVTGMITNTASVDPENAIPEGNEGNNTSALVDTQVVSGAPLPALSINLTDNGAELAGAGPDPATPNDLMTYKVLVTNTTADRADDVRIVVGTQGLRADSIIATQVVTNGTIGNFGGCVVTAPQTVCQVRTLNPGGTILMTVQGYIIASAGSQIITTGTVTGNIRNDGYSATDTELTTIKPRVDLTITKSDSPDPVCARSWPGGAPIPLICRGGLTYTYVIGNSGIHSVTGALAFRDPLPAGTILDSVSAPAPFTCSVDAFNVLSCTGGNIGPETTTTITAVLVAPGVPGPITNIAYVDPYNAIFEADENNNTATAVTQVITGVDLIVTKSASPDPVATSGTLTYTITVNNIGTQDATGVRLRDTLPAETRFRSVIADGSHNFTCSHFSGVVECFGGMIKGTASNNYSGLGGNLANPPDTATIVIKIFAQPYEGTMHNEVRVDPLNEILEANEANNISFVDTLVQSMVSGGAAFNQLTIAKAQTSPLPKDQTARNAKVTYLIVVGNNGSDPAVGVTVRDFLPAGARYIEASGTNEFNCNQVGGHVECVGGTIPATGQPGNPASITVKMFAPDAPGIYVNQAIVDPDNTIPEGNELDNQAFETTTVINGGQGAFNDLRIDKTTSTPTTTPLGPIAYRLQIWNEGSDPALGVTVRDVLPAGVTFVSAIDTNLGLGASFICSHANSVVTCSGGTIAEGGVPAARFIDIAATAPNQNVPGGLRNVATVDPDNTIPEGNEFNNTDFADVVVASNVNLKIDKDGPTQATQSEVTEYILTVSNNAVSGGGQVLTGVQVVDPLPVGLIPLTVDTDNPSNWACTISQNPINLVECIGDLNASGAGSTVKITIGVFITADGGPLDNVACVDPNNNITESNELDNCSEYGTFVGPPEKQSPDLLVSKTADAASTTPDADLTYTLTISNVGTAKAKGWNGTDGLTLVDGLPDEVTFTNATTTNGWTCSHSAGTVVCHDDGSGMDPGASAQVTIVTHVNSNAAIPIVNIAAAVGAIVDPVACGDPLTCESETTPHLSNNLAQVTTAIGSSGFDLSIAPITDVPDPVAPGQGLQYTIVGINGGTSTATNVHILISVPSAGVTIPAVVGASNGFVCGPQVGNLIDCVGSLPGGGTTTITANFTTLLFGLPPSLTLAATIDPANAFAETNEGNNTQIAVTSVSTGAACSGCVELVASQLIASPEPAANGVAETILFQVVNIGDVPTSLNTATDKLLELVAVTDGTLTLGPVSSSDPASFPCFAGPALPNLVSVNCRGNLAPAQGVTITVTVTPGGGSDELAIFGTADPSSLVFEFDETNNILVQTVIVSP